MSTSDTNHAPAGRSAELDPPIDRLIRLGEVIHATGVGRATLYRWMNEGNFPIAVTLGGSRVAWRLSEIKQWIESRPRNQQTRVKRDAKPWGGA